MHVAHRKIAGIYLFLALLSPMSIYAGSGAVQPPIPDEVSANQRGLSHFRHGYYDLIPRGRKNEAHEEFAQAEKAFLRAIEINSHYVDAHRNLARLYYLQGKFAKAGEEYSQVMHLDPGDIDNYVQMALVETELGHFREAVGYLEAAKQQTEDEQIIRKLDDYIQKIPSVQ